MAKDAKADKNKIRVNQRNPEVFVLKIQDFVIWICLGFRY